MTEEIGYQTTQVVLRSILDAGGNPIEAYRVFFNWGEGQKGYVDIPKDIASAESRDRMIRAEIERQSSLWE